MSRLLHTQLDRWTQHIEITPIVWDGVPFNIPVFAVYAIIKQPVFDRMVIKDDKLVPILKMDKYDIPIVEPHLKELTITPNFAIVLSHFINDEFSLYAFPADHVDDNYEISYQKWLLEQSTNLFYQD